MFQLEDKQTDTGLLQAGANRLFVHKAYRQQNTARPSNADIGLGIRSVTGIFC